MTVRLVEVFNQTREIRFARGGPEMAAGVCCGLSLRWLKLRERIPEVSLRLTRLGMEIPKAATIEQTHALLCLNQQPGPNDSVAMHWTKVHNALLATLDRFGFRVLDTWPENTHHAAMDPLEIGTGFLMMVPRYFVVSMDMGEKHMCAGYCHPNANLVEFFDPNRGEYVSDEGIAGIINVYGTQVRHIRFYDVGLPE